MGQQDHSIDCFGQVELLDSSFGVAVVDPDLALAGGVHFEDALALLLLAHFEGGAFGGADDDHGLLVVALVHRFVYVHHVLEGYVVVLPHLLVLEEVFSYFSIQFLDAFVQFLLFIGHFLHLLAHFRDFPLDFGVLVASDPADGVFLYFLDVIDALQNIGDIVDSSFLDFQLLYCHVEVDGGVVAAFDEVDEFFGEDGEGVILATSSAFFLLFAVPAHLLVFFLVAGVVFFELGKVLFRLFLTH